MTETFKKSTDKELTKQELVIDFIDPKNEVPISNRDCLIKINLRGWAAGYYDDVYIYMLGKYNKKKTVWEYFDVSGGKYPLDKDSGIVVGWRYIEEC